MHKKWGTAGTISGFSFSEKLWLLQTPSSPRDLLPSSVVHLHSETPNSLTFWLQLHHRADLSRPSSASLTTCLSPVQPPRTLFPPPSQWLSLSISQQLPVPHNARQRRDRPRFLVLHQKLVDQAHVALLRRAKDNVFTAFCSLQGQHFRPSLETFAVAGVGEIDAALGQVGRPGELALYPRLCTYDRYDSGTGLGQWEHIVRGFHCNRPTLMSCSVHGESFGVA
ncbi:hypothetical protein BJ742DRAFT_388043 [Cladochytrium replicatum]|nr:hypothetical protein BJ742DRAFT_388043 [Cladochytrium replicatum]